jgi:hypothetical protein
MCARKAVNANNGHSREKHQHVVAKNLLSGELLTNDKAVTHYLCCS